MSFPTYSLLFAICVHTRSSHDPGFGWDEMKDGTDSLFAEAADAAAQFELVL